MFYEGDINSGIAAALQESKCVVCFIEDETPESNKWATQWMCKSSVAESLAQNAITLRIASGSSEARAFTAFCPIERTPTLAVVFQSRLIQQLNSGISEEHFVTRLLQALEKKSRIAPTPSTSQSSTTQTPTSPPTQSPSTQSSIRSVFEERRRRLEAEREAKEAADKLKEAEKRELERQRRQQLDAANPGRSDYVKELAQRKKEAARDKERVKALIEEDKARRKEEREWKRRAEEERVQEEAQPEAAASTTMAGPTVEAKMKSPEAHEMTSIQVRLFDGGTIRAPFGIKSTLQDVRHWVDSTRDDGKETFRFKEIRTPKPSRNIEPKHESKSLHELELFPTASLALIPGDSATASARNVAGQAFQYVNMLILWIYQWMRSLFDRVRPASQDADEQQSEARPQGSGTSTGAENMQRDGRGIRIRTLKDQHPEKEDTRFYNGNQLSFEPNTLDSDQDKKD